MSDNSRQTTHRVFACALALLMLFSCEQPKPHARPASTPAPAGVHIQDVFWQARDMPVAADAYPEIHLSRDELTLYRTSRWEEPEAVFSMSLEGGRVDAQRLRGEPISSLAEALRSLSHDGGWYRFEEQPFSAPADRSLLGQAFERIGLIEPSRGPLPERRRQCVREQPGFFLPVGPGRRAHCDGGMCDGAPLLLFVDAGASIAYATVLAVLQTAMRRGVDVLFARRDSEGIARVFPLEVPRLDISPPSDTRPADFKACYELHLIFDDAGSQRYFVTLERARGSRTEGIFSGEDRMRQVCGEALEVRSPDASPLSLDELPRDLVCPGVVLVPAHEGVDFNAMLERSRVLGAWSGALVHPSLSDAHSIAQVPQREIFADQLSDRVEEYRQCAMALFALPDGD